MIGELSRGRKMWLSHLCQEHSLGIKEMQMYLHEWQAFAKINIYTGHVLPLMNVFVDLLSTHHLFFFLTFQAVLSVYLHLKVINTYCSLDLLIHFHLIPAEKAMKKRLLMSEYRQSMLAYVLSLLKRFSEMYLINT